MRNFVLLLSFALLASVASLSPKSSSKFPNGWVFGCLHGNYSYTFPFCDHTRPLDERVTDLLQRLTLEEKMGLMGADTTTKVDNCNCMDHGVPRLGIPPYMNLVETNSAVASACISPYVCATEFPGPTGLAASFNRTLWHRKGEIISTEMRAFNNFGWWRATGDAPYSLIGLTGFGPNINIVRDPRFGRNSELPSEDPFLSGSYGTFYVRGMQEGPDPRYLKMISGLKHFTAYSVETNRGGFIPQISQFDLFDTYLAQYKMAFSREGGNAQAVMCSYAGINSVPSCGNSYLLNYMMRNVWQRDDAVVVTDCGAINNMVYDNHYAKNGPDAAAKSLNGGADIDFGDGFFPPPKFGGNGALYEALKNNQTDNLRIDSAVRRILTARFRTGLFDPLEIQTYTQIGISEINSTAHQEFNLDAALQSLVLLKNDQNTLPFRPGQRLAVIGPHVYSTRDLMEDYKGDQECFGGGDDCVPTIAQVFTLLHGKSNTVVVKGVDLDSQNSSGIPEAVAAAQAADQVILCLGLGNQQEHEGIDRSDIRLPGLQESFALKVLSMKKPTVVVLINGGMLAIDNIIPQAPALIEAFYPSMRGAEALYKAIFGFANRWGRMPVTIYPYSFQQKQPLTDFDMTKSPGRTYRYYTDTPLFPFGFGLSYTTFSLSCKSSTTTNTDDFEDLAVVTCDVANTGKMGGDVVILAYHRVSDAIRSHANHPVPLKSLVEFNRVAVPLTPFNSVVVQMKIPITRLAITNNNGDKVLYAGTHYIDVTEGSTTTVSLSFQIDTTKVFPSS